MELEVGSVEEVVENASDSDVDVDDSSIPTSAPQLSSAQLLMQATQATQGKQVALPPKPKGKLVATPPPKTKVNAVQKTALPAKTGPAKQSALMAQSAKQANLLAQAVRQSNVQKQTTVIQPAKPPVPQSPKQTNVTPQTPKTNVSQASKIGNVISQVIKPPTIVKQGTGQAKQISQTLPTSQSPKLTQPQQTKQIIVNQSGNLATQLSKSLPSVVATPHKSPLIKQRPLQKLEGSQSQVNMVCFLQRCEFCQTSHHVY